MSVVTVPTSRLTPRVDRVYAAEGAPRAAQQRRAGDRGVAAALCVALLVIYNANGREIGSYDTQPTKFAARELLLRGTLHLDAVVAATPEYADRWGFIHGADGHYRSIYSPVPAIMAAAVVWPFWRAGLIDIRAPLAPGLMAVLTASLLVSLAVAGAFLTARQRLPRRRALLVAVGLGLGTGLWSTASQTLWQTETAVFGLALAVLVFGSPREHLTGWGALTIGLGLGLAGATRPQLAPLVACLLAGTWMRASPRHALLATTIAGGFAAAMCAVNLRWFGHPFGALPLLQDVNAAIHDTGASFDPSLAGFAGLLVSPSRGLFVFSPVALVAVAGLSRAFRAGLRSPLPWCALALLTQYTLYASYAVWWGGHTYGPRYLLDVLPVAVPLAAAALAPPGPGALTRLAGIAALAWSVTVAATGAFCYPHDRWNVDPADVDRHHRRLWSLSDNQIRRCWVRGPSPQNFSLLDRAAVRRTDE
jgi:hypothetical protein